MISNFDLENLIRLVEVRPIIWDRTMEGYRNSRFTKAAWQEIYCELVDNFHTLDDQKKSELGKFITAKWTQARDVWHKGLKKRRELNEPEPLPGSKEAIRYERMKFLLKVYCYKEDIEQADQNQSGDFQLEEFQSGEWKSFMIAPPVSPSEADTLLNFRLNNNIRDEKPPQTITSQNQMVKEEMQGSPTIERKRYKLDSLNQYKVKKIKKEHHAGSGINRRAHNKSLTRKHSSSMKINTSGSLNNVKPKNELEIINTHEELVSFISSNETKPIIKQEDQPTSSNDNVIEEHAVENKSITTRPVEVCENDEMSTFLRSLKPRIESFDEVQYMDFQMGVIHLIKKIKYPNRG